MITVFIAHEIGCKPSEMQRIQVSADATLESVANEHNLNDYIANIGGGEDDFVLDSDWKETSVNTDKIILFVAVPEGGDSDVVGFIVSIAVLVAAPYLASTIFGAGYSTTQLAMTTLGLQVASSALLPAPELPRPQKVPEPSAQYSARVQTNIARLGEPVPIQFGRIPNRLPDAVAPEYYEYNDNDQFVAMRYCLGLGEFQVHDLYFKNINIDDIPGAQYEIVLPNQTGSLLPANTYPSFEIPGGDATTAWSASAFSCPKGVEVDRIGNDIGFLGGLGQFNNNGDIQDHSVTVEWRYRLVNDTNTPVGSWNSLDTRTITAATVDPQRRSFYVDVARGRHEVQFRLVTAPVAEADKRKTREAVTWAGLRGQNADHVVLDDRTLINVKIRINEGSNKLIGDTLRNFTVDCTALNAEYNGNNWLTNVASRSMPWALASAYYHENMGARDVSRLWLDDLKALHDKLESLGHHFDYVFDQKISLLEAMQFIARHGRCVVIPQLGTITVVRDEPQTAITHVFQPDNCRNFSLEIENVLPFDHVVVTYSDAVTGQPKQAEYAPTGSQKQRVNKVPMLGISSRLHALSEAKHFYLSNKETVTASLETTNLKKPITFGSRVLVPQTRRMARQYGVIKQREGNKLKLSNPHGLTASDIGTASLAFDDCYHDVTVLNILSVVNDYTVTVDPIPAFLDIIDAYQTQEPTHYLLQDAVINRRIMRVKSIGGETDGWRKVELVSVGIEEPIIDPNDDDTDVIVTGENLTIRNLSVKQKADNEHFILTCAVDALADADSYICQINTGAGAWRTVYSGVEPQWRFTADIGSLQVRVAAVGSVVGAWLTKTVQVGDVNETEIIAAPLEISGGFVSGELVMQVAQVKGAAKYRWLIYDTASMTLRHTEETQYHYTYTRQQAIADGGAWRGVTVQVYSIDIAGNVSDAYAEQGFSDSQIGVLANISAVGFTEQVLVTWDFPLEIDALGVLVYASQTPGFTPSVFNLKGEARGEQFSFAVSAGETWYVRVAAFDVLGQDNLTFSDEVEVTASKLGPSELELDQVRDAVIIADSITADKLKINEVRDAVLIADSITSTQIADGSIKTPHLTAGAVDSSKIKAGAITAEKIAAYTITAVKLAANSVIASKIQAGAITAIKLAAGSVTATKIAANAVTANKISVAYLSSITSNIGTVIAGLIRSADNRFNLNLNATGSSYRIFQKNLANQLTFWVKADGSAYFDGNVQVRNLIGSHAIFDTIHMKTGALAVFRDAYIAGLKHIPPESNTWVCSVNATLKGYRAEVRVSMRFTPDNGGSWCSDYSMGPVTINIYANGALIDSIETESNDYINVSTIYVHTGSVNFTVYVKGHGLHIDPCADSPTYTNTYYYVSKRRIIVSELAKAG